jgi:threonine/homoserine/homoserine lactone efflux protein
VAWALAGIVVANVAVAWVFAAVAAVGALAMIWLTVSATRARI